MSPGESKYGSLFRSEGEQEEERAGEIAPLQPRKRRNRKKTGKRSDPNYRQVTAYVRHETYEAVHHALVGKQNNRGKKLEFSELVDTLLAEWAEEEGWSPDDLRGARR